LLAVGTFIPAAAQSKPLTGGAGGVNAGAGAGAVGILPGKGSSQVEHLDALAALERPHSEQALVSLLVVGAFMPAAAKSNALTGAGVALKDEGPLGFGKLGPMVNGLAGLGGLGL